MREVVWVEIPGHPDYLISNYGEVLNSRTDKLVKPYINSGYLRFRMDGGKYYIHKIMMIAFYPYENPDQYVTHLDGDRLNNCLWNLDYKTSAMHSSGIVRCKDCRHREYCDISKSEYDDFYCADGEI